MDGGADANADFLALSQWLSKALGTARYVGIPIPLLCERVNSSPVRNSSAIFVGARRSLGDFLTRLETRSDLARTRRSDRRPSPTILRIPRQRVYIRKAQMSEKCLRRGDPRS